MRSQRLLITLILGLGLGLIVAWAAQGQGLPVITAPAAGEVYCVTPGGGTYPTCDQVFTTVQAAVDAASDGEEIRVAAGTYTGVSSRAAPPGYDGPSMIIQVVYITKTVTVRGGYATINWTTADPVANPTTLDGGGLGRGVFISGIIAPTIAAIEGLRITGGDATGLGGGSGGHDAGGGIYVSAISATISECVIYNNTASTDDWGYGGGLYAQGSTTAIISNTVQGNTASAGSGLEIRGGGGGLCLFLGHATVRGNTVQGNTASTADEGYGGGLVLGESVATLSGNTVQGNTASTADEGFGGGILVEGGDVTIEANTVQLNVASAITTGLGGGLSLWGGSATLSGNTILRNTATLNPIAAGQGGGLQVSDGSVFTLTNNLVADNHATTEGSGLWFGSDWWSAPVTGRSRHATIADNRGSGQGVFVGDYTTLAFTNTIVAGHAGVGITVAPTGTVTLAATLWHNNGAHTGGGGTLISSTNIYSAPLFVNPAGWDYHLTAGSPAIDAGLYAGVDGDIDGDQRPADGDVDGTATVDLGADEFTPPRIYLPAVLRSHGS
jgi:hypothetical protein